MNKVILYSFCGLLLFGCKDPVVERSEEYMNVYIPMVQKKETLLQMAPIVTNTVNYVELENLKFDKDTTFYLGVYCGGMVLPSEDVKVEFSIATDSLSSLQKKGVFQSNFTMLPQEYYSIDSWETIIPRNKTTGYLEIILRTSDIPVESNFILPIKVSNVSKYQLDLPNSFILLGVRN